MNVTPGNRIITAGMPGVTAKNSFGAHQTALENTVGGDGVLSVVRAGGVKTTLIADQQTEGTLVQRDQLDYKLCQHIGLPVIVRPGGCVVG